MSLYILSTPAFAIEPSTILQFPKTANGGVMPSSTITGPTNVFFESVVEDASGNLFVGGYTYSPPGTIGPGTVNILEYAAGASGTATPIRTITGPATGLQVLTNNLVYSLDLDSAGNLYVVANVATGSGPGNLIYQGISVYAPSETGNAAPTRVILGNATTLGNISQIAVDPTGNVYVANEPATQPDSILVFDSMAKGNVAPVATIAGSNTMIYYARGVAVDSTGNIYVATLAQATGPMAATLGGTPSILVFASGATGNVAPTRVISGAATTMGEIGNLRVDSAGNIYVYSQTTILKFASGAAGNVAPMNTISPTPFDIFDSSLAVQ